MSLDFKSTDDLIILIGKSVNDISSSEYLVKYHKVDASPTPYFDLEEEHRLHQCVSSMIKDKTINAAHDCADGGLFVSLVEMALHSNLGFEINTNKLIRKDAFLFGEAQGRVVITTVREKLAQIEIICKRYNVPFEIIGKVNSEPSISVNEQSFGKIEDFRKISHDVINL